MDNRQVEAGQRFDALSELFNPSTFRHLAALGLVPGWRVWEVGAGGPTLLSWLAEQVGPDGQVLATDIDTAWDAHTLATRSAGMTWGWTRRRRDRSISCTPTCCWFMCRSGTERWPR